jgi:hypothetical protein
MTARAVPTGACLDRKRRAIEPIVDGPGSPACIVHSGDCPDWGAGRLRPELRRGKRNIQKHVPALYDDAVAAPGRRRRIR